MVSGGACHANFRSSIDHPVRAQMRLETGVRQEKKSAFGASPFIGKRCLPGRDADQENARDFYHYHQTVGMPYEPVWAPRFSTLASVVMMRVVRRLPGVASTRSRMLPLFIRPLP